MLIGAKAGIRGEYRGLSVWLMTSCRLALRNGDDAAEEVDIIAAPLSGSW